MTTTLEKPVTKAWRKLLTSLPGYDPFELAEGCWFNSSEEDGAQYYIDFIQECCTHIEGKIAGKPFILEQWEKAIVANLFGWYRHDFLNRVVRRYRKCLVYIPRKNGKCLALDTRLPTLSGWVTMADVQVGDQLFDEFGESCNVIAVHPTLSGHRCYRLTFSDHTSIVADADHLWRTFDASARQAISNADIKNYPEKWVAWKSIRGKSSSVLTTRQIVESLDVKPNYTNHSIPVTAPLKLPTTILSVDPFVLGVWLGDGSSSSGSARISADHNNGDQSLIREEFCRRGYATSDISDPVQFGVPGLIGLLAQVGVVANKHVPLEYLRSSVEQRLDLLRGLMLTDGTITEAGQVAFENTNEQLIDAVVELGRSLGQKPCKRLLNRKTMANKSVWRVNWSPTIDVFGFGRKAARLRLDGTQSIQHHHRMIVSVEPVSSVPVRCIQVDSPSHLFLAGEGMVATHNTPFAAAIHNAIFFMDDEPGQINNLAASSRDQATKLYRHIDGMIQNENRMSSRCRTYATPRTITKNDYSVTKVIPADDKVAHGDNPHFQAIDELHAQPNRKLYTALTSAMSSANRLQPLLLMLTTADYDRPSICNDEYNYAIKVRDGIIKDSTYLPVIYEAMHLNEAGRLVEDDWTSEKTWYKANPNLGVSKSIDYMREVCLRAREDVSVEGDFKRLDLNIRTQQAQRVLSMEAWDSCAENTNWLTFEGKPCWAALDVGAIRDFVSLIILFGDSRGEATQITYEDIHGQENVINFVRRDYWLRHFCWLPESPVSRDPRMSSQIAAWSQQGHIIRTPGNVVDYDQVGADISRFIQPYGLQEFAIDQGFQGMQITQDLQKLFGEETVVAFRQGILSMAAPFRELMQLMLLKRLHHDGDPVLRWMASNVAAETRGGLIKPSKDKSTEKIDGITALTMAIGIAMTAKPAKVSKYETQGLETLGDG